MPNILKFKHIMCTSQDNNCYSQIYHAIQWHREVTTEEYTKTHAWQANNTYTNTYTKCTYNIYIADTKKFQSPPFTNKIVVSNKEKNWVHINKYW
jgi:hypothetical protein